MSNWLNLLDSTRNMFQAGDEGRVPLEREVGAIDHECDEGEGT